MNRSRYRSRTRSRSSAFTTSLTQGMTLVGQDSFTDTNGTNLVDHTPELGTWTATAAGAYVIQSNQLTNTTTPGFTTMEGPTTRGVVSMDVVTAPAILGMAPVVHYIDANNNIVLASIITWQLAEKTAGSNVQVLDTGLTPTNGDHVDLVLDGTTVVLRINGKVATTMTGIAAGKVSEASHGFSDISAASTGVFDNWSMYAP